MPIPYATETITDGALGAVADNPSNVIAMVGASSSGTVNTIYQFTQPQSVRDTLGYGPLAEAAGLHLVRGGGRLTVLAVPATKTAGSLAAGAQVGTGLGTVGDSSSAPNDDYDLVIKITLGGAVATAKFQYSLDGGFTYSQDILTAATYTIPNTGVTLAFSSTPGPFVLGDQYPFEVKGPTVTAANVSTAIDALIADPRRWKLLHVVGIPTDATVGNSTASNADVKAEALAALSRYARIICDGPEVAESGLAAAYTSFPLKRTGVGAGFCKLTQVLTASTVKRPAAWPLVSRAAAAPISEDLGRVKSGPLAGVGRLKSTTSDTISWSYNDENFSTVGLDAAGFMTLRTIPGLAGVFATQGTMATSATSDFRLLQYGMVMDRACTVAHDAMLLLLNDGVRVNATTGYIDERDAKAIETEVRQKLVAALLSEGHASDVQFSLRRDNNVLSTKKLLYRVRVVPLGYAKFIEGEFGFLNPAISPAA